MFRFTVRGLLWLMMVLAWAETSGAVEPSKLEQALAKNITFETDEEALIHVIPRLEKLVRREYPDFVVQINWKDRELEGITRSTRNSAARFDDTSVADILTALVVRDNPVPQIKGLSDPDLKVVWTIGTDPNQPDRKIVIITTRAAAKKRGDKLPEVFEPKAKAK